MKKLVVAGILVASSLFVTGAAQAEPLPGGQPPCSIIYHSPAQQPIGGPLCTHPVPGT
ncbi:MAG TPA: hypothetical protein VHL53_19430 [Acidimicrobiia bacterium]|nr:hypothetical protein [Acidimicrobiia bacterium]